MDNVDVSDNGFFKLFQNLRPSKVTGPDSVPACILKELAPVQTPVFQRSLDSRHCPSLRKETNNIQRTTEQHPANYRPVSLTTSFTCNRIFNLRHILNYAQHGFRKTQLLVTVYNNCWGTR